MRAEDTVARLGGDEFIVLLAQVTGAGDAARAPFRLDGHDVSVGAS